MSKVHPIAITAEGHLLCPACGDEHNHIGDISAFSSEDDCGYGFDTEGHYRGGGLKLWMHGECGHKWKLHIQHHKGETMMFASIPEDEASDKKETP